MDARESQEQQVVSIHAPVKVRQPLKKLKGKLKGVSIHAPVKVRQAEFEKYSGKVMFQFTHL